MSRIRERLDDENRARLRGMEPAERLAEALALGDAAVAIYAAAHGVSRPDALRRFERASQAGRRTSMVMRRTAG